MMKNLTLIELQELIEMNGTEMEFVLSSDNQYNYPTRIDYELVFNHVSISPQKNEIKFFDGNNFFKLCRVVEVVLRTISGETGQAIDIFSKNFGGTNPLKYTVLVN